jgi:hypothetical protein
MLCAAVMTTTSGRRELWKCIESVQAQTYPVRHYILTDGILPFDTKAKYETDFCRTVNYLKSHAYKDVEFMYLSAKVGTPYLCGCRLYAGCVNMITEDVVFMLDDDNFYEPTHVADLMKLIMQGNDWAFSLRNITDRDGNFICKDDCESLGHHHPTWNSLGSFLKKERPDVEHMIDTSAYAFKRQMLQSLAWVWTIDHYGPDRTMCREAMKVYPKFACSNKYTLNYSIGSNALSVKKDFFDQGNAFVKERHPQGLPWHELQSIKIL